MALITVPTTSYSRAKFTSGKHAEVMRDSSDGLTSFTANPDAQKATEGVSLENVFSADDVFKSDQKEQHQYTISEILRDSFGVPSGYHWYFLRVNYGRAEKFYYDHKDNKDGYLLWMPCQKNIKFRDGKRIESLIPIFKSNLFIFATEKQAFKLTHHAPMTGYSYVDFAYDHTNQNEFGRDHKMIIPFKEMCQFIKAENVHHPWAHVVSPEQIHYREGGRVRIIGGSFEGVEGYVARVFGQTRVIVTIKGIVNYATAYVSQKYLLPIDDLEENEPKKPEAGNSIARRVVRHEVRMGGYVPKDDEEKQSKGKRNKK